MQSWIEECFKSAQANILVISRDIEIANSIDCQSVSDIYAVASDIQKLQAPREELCSLGRIDSYIRNVHGLVKTIETLTSLSKDRVMIIWVRKFPNKFSTIAKHSWSLISLPPF